MVLFNIFLIAALLYVVSKPLRSMGRAMLGEPFRPPQMQPRQRAEENRGPRVPPSKRYPGEDIEDAKWIDLD